MADYAIHDTTLTGISNVIRKKEGSSALIDPADYADRINLMGMLEEKTIVSSPIADFSDGADDVPTKSLVATIAPTLSGVSSVVCTQAGANVLDLSNATPWYAAYGLTASVSGDTVTISGTYNSTIVNPTFRILQNVPNNGCNLKAYNVSGISQIDMSWQTGENQLVVKCYGMTQNQQYNITFKPLGYFGATAPSSYKAYEAPTQYTATLGRTIYGGTADIIKGEGKELYTRVKISDLSWSIQTVSGRSAFVSGQVTGLPTTSPKNVLCDVLTYDGEKTIGGMTDKTLVTWTNTFRVYDTDCEDVTEFLSTYGNGYIVYQLIESAQTDFTFTGQEVPTRLGYNAFWSEQGNTEVTYRASGTIYNYPRGEEASF